MEVAYILKLGNTQSVKLATHYHVVPRLKMKTDPVTH